MRCGLAFDCGENNVNIRRFFRISLDKIDISLVKKVSLQDLCSFTMHFYNEEVLKRFLFSYYPELKSYAFCKLVILDEDTMKGLKIPYKKDAMYFRLEVLSQLLCKYIDDKNFRWAFLNHFINYYPDVSGDSLRAILNSNADYDSVWQEILNFLTSLVYYKGEFNYETLYDVSTFIMKLISEYLGGRIIQHCADAESVTDFEAEWLVRRECLREKEVTRV